MNIKSVRVVQGQMKEYAVINRTRWVDPSLSLYLSLGQIALVERQVIRWSLVYGSLYGKDKLVILKWKKECAMQRLTPGSLTTYSASYSLLLKRDVSTNHHRHFLPSLTSTLRQTVCINTSNSHAENFNYKLIQIAISHWTFKERQHHQNKEENWMNGGVTYKKG